MQIYRSSIIKKIIFLIILLVFSLPITFIVKYIEDFGGITVNILNYFSSGKSLFIPYLPELIIISFKFNYEIIFNLSLGKIIDLFILCNIVCYANSIFYHLFSHVNEESYFETNTAVILYQYISDHDNSNNSDQNVENDIFFNLSEPNPLDSIVWKRGNGNSRLIYWGISKNICLGGIPIFKLLTLFRNCKPSVIHIKPQCTNKLLLTQYKYAYCNLEKSSIIFFIYKKDLEIHNKRFSFFIYSLFSNHFSYLNDLIIERWGDI